MSLFGLIQLNLQLLVVLDFLLLHHDCIFLFRLLDLLFVILVLLLVLPEVIYLLLMLSGHLFYLLFQLFGLGDTILMVYLESSVLVKDTGHFFIFVS